MDSRKWAQIKLSLAYLNSNNILLLSIYICQTQYKSNNRNISLPSKNDPNNWLKLITEEKKIDPIQTNMHVLLSNSIIATGDIFSYYMSLSVAILMGYK